MSYDDDFPIYALEHHGVKGMKWGVRKDPNKPVSAKKQAKMEKKADKKWEKGMTTAKIQKAMSESDSRTKKQQEEAFKKLSKTDTFKKSQSGDPFASMKLNFEWTATYASILNSDFAKQVELKSPSGKKAIEVTLAQIGDKPFMAPKIVDKE